MGRLELGKAVASRESARQVLLLDGLRRGRRTDDPLRRRRRNRLSLRRHLGVRPADRTHATDRTGWLRRLERHGRLWRIDRGGWLWQLDRAASYGVGRASVLQGAAARRQEAR